MNGQPVPKPVWIFIPVLLLLWFGILYVILNAVLQAI